MKQDLEVMMADLVTDRPRMGPASDNALADTIVTQAVYIRKLEIDLHTTCGKWLVAEKELARVEGLAEERAVKMRSLDLEVRDLQGELAVAEKRVEDMKGHLAIAVEREMRAAKRRRK